MSYLVMEVHPAYAVVLDEEGRFLKAANLRYQVGDTVRDIVELRHPREKRPALGPLPIKQVLKNKYYGSCRTRVADKRGMCH